MIDKVKQDIEKLVNNDDVHIYNVEYVRELHNNILRVTIDSNTKEVDLDLCVEVTNIVNTFLDETDPISDEYMLEVSSRGAEEAIETDEALANAVGKVVYIEVKESVDKFDNFNGTLLEVNEHSVLIQCNIKSVMKKFEIQLNNINYIRHSVEF